MKLSYKYRIYPNTSQREALDGIFASCRYLYNCALEERISLYKKYNKSLSYSAQCAELKDVKDFPEFENIYSQTLQQVLKQLYTSYQNFFKRVKKKSDIVGFPRFKGKNRFRSICFPQVAEQLDGIGGVKRLPNNKLKIYGVAGEVKVKWHRPWKGRCKQVRIVRSNSDKYYIVISCDEVPLEPLAKTNNVIGIDLGITNFITVDDGTKFHHPKPYKTSKEKLAFLQRKLAAKQKASKNNQRLKSQIARKFEHQTNIRNDFQHKVAKQLVDENDTIIIEKLNIKSMLEAKGFEINKSNISEASWGNFVALLFYKAERAGRKVIEVEPKNTSRMCFCCSNIKNNLSLKDREYCCEACGFAIDRDINAAKNIKRLGMSLAAHFQ